MRKETISGIDVLSPKGYLTGGDDTGALEAKLKQLTDAGARFIVLDLSKVDYVNNTALGVLISYHAQCTKRGGQLVFTSVNDRIKNIFTITKLSLIFEVYPTVAPAVAALRRLAGLDPEEEPS